MKRESTSGHSVTKEESNGKASVLTPASLLSLSPSSPLSSVLPAPDNQPLQFLSVGFQPMTGLNPFLDLTNCPS